MNRNNSLRRIRRARDITQLELAKKVGSNISMISFIENRNYNADEDMKKKLARALNCKVSELWPE
ncbi:hypothetical protein ES705_41122 [subsurface metagenome]